MLHLEASVSKLTYVIVGSIQFHLHCGFVSLRFYMAIGWRIPLAPSHMPRHPPPNIETSFKANKGDNLLVGWKLHSI